MQCGLIGRGEVVTIFRRGISEKLDEQKPELKRKDIMRNRLPFRAFDSRYDPPSDVGSEPEQHAAARTLPIRHICKAEEP
jgi:hypothetical protein